jgi:U3 small nucleolar RNA-associated protein 14
MIVAGKLDAEFIAGKYYTTLAAINDMRERCRVKAKDHDLPSTAEATGSSETDKSTVALDAMNMTAKALKENLQSTSSKSTTRPKPSAKVIPIQQK